MVTVQDIYDLMNEKAPFSIQMSFDNAGFLVGDRTQPVTKVLVALDITEEVAQEAAERGCQLIVSHHPVIFHPVKQITTDDPTGRKLRALIRNDLSAICCHTNLDMAEDGVNDQLARKAGLIDLELLAVEGSYPDGTPYGCGRVGNLATGETTLAKYLTFLKTQLAPNGLRYVDAGKPIHRVAVGGGACADYMDDALRLGCDTFVTSDVKYDGFLDAKAKGLNLIDAGHFPTENVVCPQIAGWIRDAFPAVEVTLSERHKEVFSYFNGN
jgi:dinuclear metal center YbgI/SA1388 family protein